jgi:hypothetical protein
MYAHVLPPVEVGLGTTLFHRPAGRFSLALNHPENGETPA